MSTRPIPTLGIVIIAAAISAPWIVILYQSEWFQAKTSSPPENIIQAPPTPSLVNERTPRPAPIPELETLEDMISEENDSSLLASQASLTGWTWADEGAATMLPLTLAELAASERPEHNALAAEEAELARRQAELDDQALQLGLDASALAEWEL